ncbi:hypothetical protein O181_085853 [Austropuccinia psidii MF-1]|uniref:Uncharacterized protein n=1 Tax=Austropuccinia psidii MF-1 TaxID=1389203 RepID=A0A9Q3FTX9_9BASI|nr:hypothetical protein [Austropuccinia psidii MF-1]
MAFWLPYLHGWLFLDRDLLSNFLNIPHMIESPLLWRAPFDLEEANHSQETHDLAQTTTMDGHNLHLAWRALFSTYTVSTKSKSGGRLSMKRIVLLKDGIGKETIDLSKSFSTISTERTFSTDILLGLVKFPVECIQWTSYILQTRKQTSSVLKQQLCFKSMLRRKRVINQIKGAQAIVE